MVGGAGRAAGELGAVASAPAEANCLGVDRHGEAAEVDIEARRRRLVVPEPRLQPSEASGGRVHLHLGSGERDLLPGLLREGRHVRQRPTGGRLEAAAAARDHFSGGPVDQRVQDPVPVRAPGAGIGKELGPHPVERRGTPTPGWAPGPLGLRGRFRLDAGAEAELTEAEAAGPLDLTAGGDGPEGEHGDETHRRHDPALHEGIPSRMICSSTAGSSSSLTSPPIRQPPSRWTRTKL